MIRSLLTTTLLTTAIAALAFPAFSCPKSASDSTTQSSLESVLTKMAKNRTPESWLLLQTYKQSPKNFEDFGKSACFGLTSRATSPSNLVSIATEGWPLESSAQLGLDTKVLGRMMVKASVAAYCPEYSTELSRY